MFSIIVFENLWGSCVCFVGCEAFSDHRYGTKFTGSRHRKDTYKWVSSSRGHSEE